MANPDFTKRLGDTATVLRAQLVDADGAVNLTGATVKLKVLPKRSDTLVVNGACVVEDAVNAYVRYEDWAIDEPPEAGLWDYLFDVTFSDGSIQSFPNGKVLLTMEITRNI